MALITWDQSYSVKVKRCDDDHRKLFDLVNALNDAMRVGKGNTVVGKIVAELGNYTKTHFKTEEALMAQTKYPALAGHKVEHQKFVAQVDQFQKDLDDGVAGDSVAVLEFLKDWLTKHIRQVDQNYSAHLNASGIH